MSLFYSSAKFGEGRKSTAPECRAASLGAYGGEVNLGSDLDLIILLKKSDKPFERRGIDFDTSPLPVPTELLVYTGDEWGKLKNDENGFYPAVSREVIWIYPE